VRPPGPLPPVHFSGGVMRKIFGGKSSGRTDFSLTCNPPEQKV